MRLKTSAKMGQKKRKKKDNKRVTNKMQVVK